MNKPITDAEFFLLIELEKKATPAPWADHDRGHGHAIEPSVAWIGNRCSYPPQPGSSHADAGLIAALRNAAKRILLELLALRKENETLLAALTESRRKECRCVHGLERWEIP